MASKRTAVELVMLQFCRLLGHAPGGRHSSGHLETCRRECGSWRTWQMDGPFKSTFSPWVEDDPEAARG